MAALAVLAVCRARARAGAGARRARAASPEVARPTSPRVAALAWLDGCWAGTVNQRDFREQWSPLRGDILLGVGSTVYQGKIAELRVPAHRAARGRRVLRRAAVGTEGGRVQARVDHDRRQGHDLHVRQSASTIFRSGSSTGAATEGWLYATIEGKLKGEDQQGHLPDAARRLRDRRVHPQVAWRRLLRPRSPVSSGCSPRAATARSCGSRSATST